ncbi:hypothetical protein [Actinomadura sp. 6N118]|uniref:hypothetical protein n=1 Tax=Actinomadura sp. 6N118 TaxID=3375151 RepID=UPI0037945760
MESIAAYVLGFFLLVVGSTHWLVPRYYLRLVPAWTPYPRYLVALSGAAEVIIGVLVLLPGTRSPAAWAAAALITGYLVSHIDALVRADAAKPWILDRPAGAAARIVVNAGYIAFAVVVAMENSR